ncbi:DUF6095 family protein [uncultured Psychroserpens sp.]|uniref:DUF6095 family protein n=1 Tax=uncultured Psychroserpens sp. TaxID=255436 RepID=UPI0026217B5E|nr:DUF6095 family protein [uncultured Psychroserpens sp.]
MENKGKTNKELLVKGIKTMGIALVLMFIGPSLVYVALSNKEKPLFIPLIIISIILCFLAIYFSFKGLQKIMDSIFKSS